MGRKLLVWLGWAGVDAVGRLVLLFFSTFIFSRFLTPADFGTAALVISLATFCAIFVGTPFEEALAQRRHLERAHIQTAGGVSLLVALVLFILSLPAGYGIGRLYGAPEITWLLPLAMTSIFGSGYSDIMTAVARRTRKFNEMAIGWVLAHVVGVVISIILAFAGFGLWALVAQRPLIVIARAMIWERQLHVRIRPAFSKPHLMDLRRMSGVSLADRVADNLNYVAFNYLIGGLYGITTLGYVNMAMRLVEPIRGAVISTGHNLSFFFFVAVHEDRKELGKRLEAVLSRGAFVVAPIFVGLAAVMPQLLPLAAGPGWEPTIPIAVCLSLGAAILMTVRPIYTALSACGKPEFSLASNVSGFLGTIALLVLGVGRGASNVGLARLAGDCTQAAIAIGLSSRHLVLTRIDRLMAVLPAWLISAGMGLVVVGCESLTTHFNAIASLFIAIAVGIASYLIAFRIFAGSAFNDLLAFIRPASMGDGARS